MGSKPHTGLLYQHCAHKCCNLWHIGFLLCHTHSPACCFIYFSFTECWNHILYKWSSFVPAALLSLKWRYLWISWNLFLDIVCGNIGVWKIPLVDHYNSNFGFRTTPLQKSNKGIFFILITVTGFHSSLRACFVMGRGIFAIFVVNINLSGQLLFQWVQDEHNGQNNSSHLLHFQLQIARPDCLWRVVFLVDNHF